MTQTVSAKRYLVMLLATILLGGTVSVVAGQEPAEAVGSGLDITEIEVPFDGVTAAKVAAVNEATDRMYVYLYTSGAYIAEYDLSTATPTFIRVSDANVTTAGLHSQNRDVIDPSRNRLLVINTGGSGNTSTIDVIDLETLTLTESWNVTVTVPGFNPTGFTYDEEVDRLYLAGEFKGTTMAGAARSSLGTTPPLGSAIVALDADSGSFVWATPLEGCDAILDSGTAGSMVAQSIHRPALYVFCVSSTVSSQQVSSNGLFRVDIEGHESETGVVDFPTDIFPVSGTYLSFKEGTAAFDPSSERVFAQSLSHRTPGAWVFDGLRDAWVGFIAAPDNNNVYYGLNPTTGRYYMGGTRGAPPDPGYVNVTDGRATPVAQGTLFEGIHIDGQMFADPDSNRVFQAGVLNNPAYPDDSPWPYITSLFMMRDNTEPIVPLPPTDLDALTADLPDDEALLQYSARVSGFGARYTVVGGWEGIYSRLVTRTTWGNLGADKPTNPTGLAFGDRGVTLAEVPGVDVRPGGAASAVAVASIDEATSSDRSDLEQQADGGDGAASETSHQLFPFERLTCLDGIGEKIEDSQDGGGVPGSASVVCDLAENTAVGSAEYSGDIGTGGVSISRSTFDTETFRDPDRGVVSETTAVAEGISIEVPGAGTLTIDRVTTRAATVANGRPDTTDASWERVVEGVVLTDAVGEKQQFESCTTTASPGSDPERDGSCQDLAETISGLSPRVRVRFPLPEVEATPKGAFAAVAEPEDEFLNGRTMNNDRSAAIAGMEVTVYNDGPEKGRLLVQLAAIDANSTFTRSPLWLASSFDPGASTGSGGTGTVAPATTEPATTERSAPAAGIETGSTASDLASTGEPAPVVAAPEQPTPAAQPLMASGWLPAARDFGDGALAGGLYGLFALPLVEAMRRRKLLSLLAG